MHSGFVFLLFKVAPYGFMIARAYGAKAQVGCARSGENVSVFRFYDVNMSTKSKTGLQMLGDLELVKLK